MRTKKIKDFLQETFFFLARILKSRCLLALSMKMRGGFPPGFPWSYDLDFLNSRSGLESHSATAAMVMAVWLRCLFLRNIGNDAFGSQKQIRL